jgi:hypothetical protein
MQHDATVLSCVRLPLPQKKIPGLLNLIFLKSEKKKVSEGIVLRVGSKFFLNFRFSVVLGFLFFCVAVWGWGVRNRVLVEVLQEFFFGFSGFPVVPHNL